MQAFVRMHLSSGAIFTGHFIAEYRQKCLHILLTCTK